MIELRCAPGGYMGCTIIGTGKALPATIVSNDDLSRIVDTSDEWIVERTGIHNRHIAIKETATDLGVAAARCALGLSPFESSDSHSFEASGWSNNVVDPKTIDLVICASMSPDATVPSQAALIKAALGLSNAVAFDINAACAGCVYGISIAASMMSAANSPTAAPVANPIKRALVIGVEVLSRLTDWADRATCVLFGDGAGAVLLEWDEQRAGILSSYLKNTDDESHSLTRAALYNNTTFPFNGPEGTNQSMAEDAFIHMNGKAVFKFAGNALAEAAEVALKRAQVQLDDVACIVPHQANERIIKYAAKKLGVSLDRFQISIANAANTSAASALIALCDAYLNNSISPHDNVLVIGFGGGLTSGAVLFEA